GGCANEQSLEGLSPEELYLGGYHAFQKTDYEKAAEYFDEIEKQHPYSEWSERAQIMAAYSYYQKNMYDDAILTLERFIQLHPGNRNTAYAYYLKGLCYFEQMSDAAREQSMTQKAQETFNDLIARYPDSVYARDAQTKMGEMTDHLAAQEMTVGRYYLKRTDLVASANRFKNVIEVYPDSDQVPEAYYRLTVCYLMMGADTAAAKVAQTGMSKYPENEWSQKMADLIKEK
ncbi:MAG: outer membrane protein assembly factor BamD, partial [Pseudomonadota bacterium]|nr:outer membrane protein assembly factor BamD [Pseudomonadota bacterium]